LNGSVASLPRVGQNSPQLTTTVLAAPAANVVSTFQTAQFIEENPGELLNFQEAGTQGIYQEIAPSIDLQNFLKRPVQINSFVWNSSWTDVSITPWTSFLNTPAILNKLQNFAYIRGKLKLKFVLNSSPFYYGAMRATYFPLWGLTPGRVDLASPTPGNPKIPYSQMPGVFMYPQTSTGGEMELPFFYHKDYLALKTASETGNIGRLYMQEFVPLRSANGAVTNGVTITLFAWMEDVQLAGFTSQLIMQGDEYDEASGVVSGPAAVLADWASYLERVPVIGRFATATRMGASTVSKIAALFGWSNVPVISSVMPFKNMPFHDLASAEISQPVSKFTLDPKAEVSVAPYMVGLSGEDELSVASIVQRDSYLTSFTWNTTDAANTLFFSSLVNPLLYDRGSPDANSTYSINQTPMCMVARLFRFWRGDIIFTFRIIASKFHRGRLRLHWEPYSSPSTTTDTSHLNMTKIVDIEDTTDVTFRIPYLQPVPWCEHTHQGDIYTTNRWSTTSVMTPSNDDDNGSLVVRCLNNLSAPVDTSPITVMVFVRGAGNLTFANPIDGLNRFSYLVPQSEDGIESATEANSGLFAKNWGEPILSLRKLLRRASLVDVRPLMLNPVASDNLREERIPMTKYPPMPGYCSLSFDVAKNLSNASTSGFNYVCMTPFAWIMPCFLGLRGSMRWHFNAINHESHGPDSLGVWRNPGVTIVAPSTNSIIPSTSTTRTLYANSQFNNISNSGSAGLALTNYEGQPGLTCEMPYMIPYKFYLNNWFSWAVGSSTDKSNADGYQVIMRTNNNNANQDMAMERYSSIGTDFNAHFFLCVPTLYYNPNMGALPS